MLRDPFSIVIPIYNEEEILEESIQALLTEVNAMNVSYELLLVENGSSDRTLKITRDLSKRYPMIRVLTLPSPSYGKAIRYGLEQSRYDKVILFNLDFWDVEFLKRSLELLEEYHYLVGSKAMKGAMDRRPWVRRWITKGFNAFLRWAFGFKGTDTHGIKAFRRHRILIPLQECLTDKEIFDTELVLRVQRDGLSFCELPVTVEEKRQSRYSIMKRIPKTIIDILKLMIALRFKPVRSLTNGNFNYYDCDRVEKLLKHFNVDEITTITLLPKEQVIRYVEFLKSKK